MSEKDDKKFQEEWKLEREMINNRQVCETCKHWQVGNSEFCLKKFICHLPDNTCLNWKEGIKAEYYHYPPNATWEEIEEINKKFIEEWKDYLETKTELEKKLLINTEDLIRQSMEVLDEMEKGQKRYVLIHWIVITFGALLGIGFIALKFFL